MQYFVNCQRSRLTKTFSTVIGLEGLVFGVYVLVISQVVLPSERLAADVTGERSLVCMRSNMFFQNAGLWAGHLAVGADVFPALSLCLLQLVVLVDHAADAVLETTLVSSRCHQAACRVLPLRHQLWGRRLRACQLLELLVEVRHSSGWLCRLSTQFSGFCVILPTHSLLKIQTL